MNWIKKKYYAFQLYCAAVQMGDKEEAQTLALYLLGLSE